jgi:hypothetical protein
MILNLLLLFLGAVSEYEHRHLQTASMLVLN